MIMHSTTLWAGKLLLLAGIATLSLSSTSRAQCCNNGSMGIEYGAPMIVGELDPEAELIEPDDPTKMINLTVVAPEKAKVIVNGEETFTKGVVRNYVVRGLKPGKSYKFEIVGEYTNEFKAVYRAKEVVNIPAGSSGRTVLHLHRVKRPEEPKPPVAAAAVAAPAGAAAAAAAAPAK